MVKQIALVTLTAAALVASPSLAHAIGGVNGLAVNGINFANSISTNGVTIKNGVSDNGIRIANGVSDNGVMLHNGVIANGVEPADREVYVVDEPASGKGSTVRTIELPRVEPRIPR